MPLSSSAWSATAGNAGFNALKIRIREGHGDLTLQLLETSASALENRNHLGARSTESLEDEQILLALVSSPDIGICQAGVQMDRFSVMLQRLLKKAGVKSMKFVCLVAAPEGIAAVHREHPEVPIFTAAVDRQLNDKGYILPGLGDAGDRIFGT